MALLLLLTATAPAFFLLWYFYHRDRYEPEPKKKILQIFMLGALMVIPASYIELISLWVLNLGGLGRATSYIWVVVFVAPTEELLKYFVVKKWIYSSTEFDEVMDGIVYAVAASLGFATVENIFYVFQHGMAIGIARAFLSVPAHAFYGALMGYHLGLAKWNKAEEGKLLTRGVVLAILAHGFFDCIALTGTVLALTSLVFFVIILGLNVRRHLALACERRTTVDSAAGAAPCPENAKPEAGGEETVARPDEDSPDS